MKRPCGPFPSNKRSIRSYRSFRAVGPGRVGVASVLKEISKLRTLTALGLPDTLFAPLPPKVLATYALRAATEPPSDLRRRPVPTRYTLGAFKQTYRNRNRPG